MSIVTSHFNYSVEDINNTIRSTNSILRSINSIRNLSNDIQSLTKAFTFTKFFWFLIQVSRTYSALRRVYNLTVAETKTAGLLMTIKPPRMPTLPDRMPVTTIPSLDLSSFNVRVDTFRENLPIRVEQLDLTNLPENTMIMLQGLLEEDAGITVADAKEMLASRIIHPEDSTGDLEASIHWETEVFGVRIVAGMPYAWWVEEGQRSFTGHHYMRDATERARIRLPVKIQEQISGLILN